jgi:hypothetical protein
VHTRSRVQVFWAFSIFLEAIAIIPQLVVLQSDKVFTAPSHDWHARYIFFEC